MSNTPTKLESEQIIVQSPLSITGGTKRVVRLMSLQFASIENPTVRSLVKVLWWVGVGAWVVGAWLMVLIGWNVLLWTVFLVPMLIIRAFGRSKRNKKVQAAQHRELMDQLQRTQQRDSDRS